MMMILCPPLKEFDFCSFCHGLYLALSMLFQSFGDKMQEPPWYNQLGCRFVEFYYNIFDTDRANLKDLYVSVALFCPISIR